MEYGVGASSNNPRITAIGYALMVGAVVAVVAACNSPDLATGSAPLGTSPDAGPPLGAVEVAAPLDPFGIAHLKTSGLDTEIGTLKDGRAFYDLEPNEQARYRAVARKRAERRSSRPVEERTPGPNAYFGDRAEPAADEDEVQP